jgi:aminoglycoside phosphotransferase (APT) family kinase protein
LCVGSWANSSPDWLNLPLSLVEPADTVNAIFRLGDQLSVRLARREGPAALDSKENDWLPRLAPLLPLEIPVPVARGHATGDPWFWDIHTWVEGETVPIEEMDATQAARDLAALVGALQKVRSAEAPPARGIPLAERDREVRY